MLGKHVDLALCDENNLPGFFLITLNIYTLCVNTGIEPDDELVPKAFLTGIEEVLEATNEPAENLVDKFCLHLGWQLLV